jgi:tRNA (guanine37-N1)-methyltransferase
MRIDIFTIFPDYLGPLDVSLIGRARQRGILDIRIHELREWTSDVHRTVDDAPYGGGPGMVMKPDVWGRALDAVLPADGGRAEAPAGGDVPRPRLIIPTPGGRRFTQRYAAELAGEQWLAFACGRYEGIDARVAADARNRMPVDEITIGDYVLSGGEVAVLVIVEAVARLLRGVLGNADSVSDDSFAPGPMGGLLEGPVYTKPAEWRGFAVPPVLLSGDHAAIARWRRDEALRRTARLRPDLIELLDPGELNARDRTVLAELGWTEISGRFSSAAADVAH